MKPFRVLSAAEQLAAHLREEIRSGGLDGEMPGVAHWVKRLGVGTKTVVAALEILKHEGMVAGGGERKRNRILAKEEPGKSRLRIRILLYEESDAYNELVMRLGHQLERHGHHFSHAAETLKDLHFDVKRVARMVQKNDADAWVIQAGSRPVLEWFAARPAPCFALFGQQAGLPMASVATLKSPAVAEALQRLVKLGHRRIVMLAREERRKPAPGLMEQRFLEELERLGIRTGTYNLPDWENDVNSFRQCLDSLFRHTRPTALLLGEPSLFFSTQQYLMGKGFAVPHDVSLLALDGSPAYEWFQPEVSHIRIDTRPSVARIVQWADNMAKGRQDRQETILRAEFVEGGMIGPAVRT